MMGFEKHCTTETTVTAQSSVLARAVQTPRFVALLCAVALAMIALVPLGLLAEPAYANIKMDAPTTVSDDITRLNVDKLDSDTHEYVKGASMAIINEETGEVVDEWVTAEGTHVNEKGLDVGVVYVLRELAAPEGYGKAEDVRFVVNETEGSGIDILSQGPDSTLSESYKIALYDEPDDSEIVTTVTKAAPPTTTTRTVAPKTGDETPLLAVALLVAAGVVLIVLLQVPKRKMED